MAFDAIIAGAGIIGASTAWRLSQSGLRVLLLDAARMGGEASSAGAGILAPSGEIEQPSPWIDLAIESLRLYPAFIAELQQETGCQIDFQHLGAVELAPSPREWQALEDRARRQSALGIASCALARHDLRQYVPLARQDVAGALFYPEDAQVDPRDLMAALRAACLAKRVEIREGVRVTAIRPRADTLIVEASSAAFETPHAVLAAGAWSSEIEVEGQSLPRAFPVAATSSDIHSSHTLWGRFSAAGTPICCSGAADSRLREPPPRRWALIGRSIRPWCRTFTRGRLRFCRGWPPAGRSRRGWDFDRRRARRSRSSAGLAEWL